METAELRGCQTYHGYLFAKPKPIDELENKLAELLALRIVTPA
ncbi:hypothetical protein [Sideroxydans sp. CL21]|nr:hypothetical protein [Sideroxydans sp. CL21]VVC85010.1 hypothetical protein [Sideroxydans sp. CL21]